MADSTGTDRVEGQAPAPERVWCDLGDGRVRVMVVADRGGDVVFKRPLQTGHGHREVRVPRRRFLDVFRDTGERATAQEFDVLVLPDLHDLDLDDDWLALDEGDRDGR